MATTRANGVLIRKLREALIINGKRASQQVLADLSVPTNRSELEKFKGEVPPNWINEFTMQWLSSVERSTDELFDDARLKSLAYILGTNIGNITFTNYENPYRGLKAFRIEDAELFAGRDQEAETVFARLTENNLVGIIGASGSGKSSLAFAGVCPLILRERPGWQLLSLRIGSKPLESLSYALDQWLFPSTDKIDRPTRIRMFQQNIRRGKDTLYHYLSWAQRDKERTPVLVIDQWEELYTLCEKEGDRDIFLANLVEAVSTGVVHVLLTVRADFYDELLCSPPPFFDLLKPNLIDLKPMTVEQLRLAVEAPLAKTGFQFDDGLIDRLLDDVGIDQGQLPILQFALSELWANREVDRNWVGYKAYESLGGVKNIIRTHANKVMKTVLAPMERRIAQVTLPMLVDLGDHGNDVKLRVSLSQFSDEQQAVLRKLSDEDCRLLSISRAIDPNDAEQTIEHVELAHEELIRSWPTLRNWLKEDLEFHRQLSRLRASLKHYTDNSQDDDFLIPEGKQLADAEKILQEYGPRLLGPIADFINKSIKKRKTKKDQESRQARNRLLWVSGIALFALIATIIATYSYINTIRREGVRSEIEQKSTISTFEAQLAKARNDLGNGDATQAIVRILSVWPKTGTKAPKLSSRHDALTLLSEAVDAQKEIYRVPGDWRELATDHSGKKLFLSDSMGRVVEFNTETGEKAEILEPLNTRLTLTDGPAVSLRPTGLSISANGRWVLQTFMSDPNNEKDEYYSPRDTDKSYFDGLLLTDLHQEVGQQVKGWWTKGNSVGAHGLAYVTALSHDGSMAAMAWDNRIHAWHTQTGKPFDLDLGLQDNIGSPLSVSFSADKRSLGIAYRSGEVVKIDLWSGEVNTYKISNSLRVAHFDKDLWSIVVAEIKPGKDEFTLRKATIHSPAKDLLSTLGFTTVSQPLEVDGATYIAISPNERLIYSSSPGRIKILNKDATKEVSDFRFGDEYSEQRTAWINDEMLAVKQAAYVSIIQPNLDHLATEKVMDTVSLRPYSFSQDGSVVIFGSEKGLHLYDIASKRSQVLGRKYGSEWSKFILDAALSPDNSLLAATTEKSEIVIFDLNQDKQLKAIETYEQPVAVEFLNSKRVLAVAFFDKGLALYRMSNSGDFVQFWYDSEIKTGERPDLEFKGDNLRLILKVEDHDLWSEFALHGKLLDPIRITSMPEAKSLTRVYEMNETRLVHGGTQTFGASYSYLGTHDIINNVATFSIDFDYSHNYNFLSSQISYDRKKAVAVNIGRNHKTAIVVADIAERKGSIFDVACNLLPFSEREKLDKYGLENVGRICTGQELDLSRPLTYSTEVGAVQPD